MFLPDHLLRRVANHEEPHDSWECGSALPRGLSTEIEYLHYMFNRMLASLLTGASWTRCTAYIALVNNATHKQCLPVIHFLYV